MSGSKSVSVESSRFDEHCHAVNGQWISSSTRHGLGSSEIFCKQSVGWDVHRWHRCQSARTTSWHDGTLRFSLEFQFDYISSNTHGCTSSSQCTRATCASRCRCSSTVADPDSLVSSEIRLSRSVDVWWWLFSISHACSQSNKYPQHSRNNAESCDERHRSHHNGGGDIRTKYVACKAITTIVDLCGIGSSHSETTVSSSTGALVLHHHRHQSATSTDNKSVSTSPQCLTNHESTYLSFIAAAAAADADSFERIGLSVRSSAFDRFRRERAATSAFHRRSIRWRRWCRRRCLRNEFEQVESSQSFHGKCKITRKSHSQRRWSTVHKNLHDQVTIEIRRWTNIVVIVVWWAGKERSSMFSCFFHTSDNWETRCRCIL